MQRVCVLIIQFRTPLHLPSIPYVVRFLDVMSIIYTQSIGVAERAANQFLTGAEMQYSLANR